MHDQLELPKPYDFYQLFCHLGRHATLRPKKSPKDQCQKSRSASFATQYHPFFQFAPTLSIEMYNQNSFFIIHFCADLLDTTSKNPPTWKTEEKKTERPAHGAHLKEGVYEVQERTPAKWLAGRLPSLWEAGVRDHLCLQWIGCVSPPFHVSTYTRYRCWELER